MIYSTITTYLNRPVPTYGLRKSTFILVFGLGWGLVTFLLITSLDIWIRHRNPTAEQLATTLLIWLAAGWWHGSSQWKRRKQ